MKRLLRCTGVGVASLALLACTTLQPLDSEPGNLQQVLRAGDEVDVTTAQGEDARFKITSVDASGLHGTGHDIAYRDIRSVSRQEMAGGRTALLVLGVLAVGAAAAGGHGGGGGGMGGGGY